MTREETIGLLALLKVNFRDDFREMTKQDAETLVNLWEMQFRDDHVEIVTAAVMALIATRESGRFPKVAEVKEQIYKITNPQEMTEQEAINLITNAVSKSGYEAKKEFDKLPPILQRIVGSQNKLREWGMMDSNAYQSVVCSNLMRSYSARVKSDRYGQALTADVKRLIGCIADMKMLTDGKEDT